MMHNGIVLSVKSQGLKVRKKENGELREIDEFIKQELKSYVSQEIKEIMNQADNELQVKKIIMKLQILKNIIKAVDIKAVMSSYYYNSDISYINSILDAMKNNPRALVEFERNALNTIWKRYNTYISSEKIQNTIDEIIKHPTIDSPYDDLLKKAGLKWPRTNRPRSRHPAPARPKPPAPPSPPSPNELRKNAIADVKAIREMAVEEAKLALDEFIKNNRLVK